MKLRLTLLVSLFTVGFALSASAGAVTDTDSDLVPDSFDNCSVVANGPGEAPDNQVDGDLDGYGNRCDADFDNSGNVSGADFTIFIGAFNQGPNSIVDLNSDGNVTGADFTIFISLFNQGPGGPSGLDCAGTIPCTP